MAVGSYNFDASGSLLSGGLGGSGASGVVSLSGGSISALASSLSSAIDNAFKSILPSILSYATNAATYRVGYNMYSPQSFLNAISGGDAISKVVANQAYNAGLINPNAYMMAMGQSYGFNAGLPSLMSHFLAAMPGGMGMLNSGLGGALETAVNETGMNPLRNAIERQKIFYGRIASAKANETLDFVNGLDADTLKAVGLTKPEEGFKTISEFKDAFYGVDLNKLKAEADAATNDADRARLNAQIKTIEDVQWQMSSIQALRDGVPPDDLASIKHITDKFDPEVLSAAEIRFNNIFGSELAINDAIHNKDNEHKTDEQKAVLDFITKDVGDVSAAKTLLSDFTKTMTPDAIRNKDSMWGQTLEKAKVSDKEIEEIAKGLGSSKFDEVAAAQQKLIRYSRTAKAEGYTNDMMKVADLQNRALVMTGGDASAASDIFNTALAWSGVSDYTHLTADAQKSMEDLMRALETFGNAEKTAAKIFDKVSQGLQEAGIATTDAFGNQTVLSGLVAGSAAKTAANLMSRGMSQDRAIETAVELETDIAGSEKGIKLGGMLGLISMRYGTKEAEKFGKQLAGVDSVAEGIEILNKAGHGDIVNDYYTMVAMNSRNAGELAAIGNPIFDRDTFQKAAAIENFSSDDAKLWFKGGSGFRKENLENERMQGVLKSFGIENPLDRDNLTQRQQAIVDLFGQYNFSDPQDVKKFAAAFKHYSAANLDKNFPIFATDSDEEVIDTLAQMNAPESAGINTDTLRRQRENLEKQLNEQMGAPAFPDITKENVTASANDQVESFVSQEKVVTSLFSALESLGNAISGDKGLKKAFDSLATAVAEATPVILGISKGP